ncbi:SRPBCC family protein [Streptomyces sp. NPDC048172]|uniref:SRPBCC family protein n=1 Tax=Streptomyces sp. NPDC048172 TaxID=3365505 RepID=UPI00371F36F8
MEFVYITVIRTTPEKLWEALTDTDLIRRYHDDTGPDSDWRPGSVVRWKMGEEYQDYGQRVLEAEPYRKLSYTWHNYTPEIGAMFGWSDEELAEHQKEPVSQVTIENEQMGEGVMLTLTHDGFAPDSEMLKAISEGWPFILSNLKSLLETGATIRLED